MFVGRIAGIHALLRRAGTRATKTENFSADAFLRLHNRRAEETRHSSPALSIPGRKPLLRRVSGVRMRLAARKRPVFLAGELPTEAIRVQARHRRYGDNQ